MYSRQSQPIGLSGLLDTIKDITAAGAMTYLQYKSGKQTQKEQEALMQRERDQLEFQRAMAVQGGTGGGFNLGLGGMTMPLIVGGGALALFLFMRK